MIVELPVSLAVDNAAMLGRVVLVCHLVLCLLFGGQAVCQVLAWCSMIYDQVDAGDTVVLAVSQTLSGQRSCDLCKAIDERPEPLAWQNRELSMSCVPPQSLHAQVLWQGSGRLLFVSTRDDPLAWDHVPPVPPPQVA